MEINSNIKTLLATSLAKHFSKYVKGRAASSTSISDVDNSLDLPSVKDMKLDQSSVTVEEVKTYKTELLSSAEITPIYTKSHNRYNFVALLVKIYLTCQEEMCMVRVMNNSILIS